MIKKVFIFSSLLIATLLSAKDYPLLQSQEIVIPNKELTVIELPFEIKGELRQGIFKRMVYKKGKSNSSKKVQVINMPTLKKAPTLNKKNGGKSKNGKTSKSSHGINHKSPIPNIKKGKNVLEIFPNSTGKMDITIWGYNKYPIVIKLVIKADPKNQMDKYLVLKDYSKQKRRALLGSSQEDAIAQMIYPMYVAKYNNYEDENSICLDGQKLTLPNWEFETTSNLKVEVSFECSGKRYAASKWIVTNLNKYPISISDKADFKSLRDNVKAYFRVIKRAIYAIDIDTENEFLFPNEKVEVYIVTDIIKKKYLRIK